MFLVATDAGGTERRRSGKREKFEGITCHLPFSVTGHYHSGHRERSLKVSLVTTFQCNWS